MRILIVSEMFPSAEFPSWGTFVAERAAALAPLADVRVIAPIPLAPPMRGGGRWARMGRVERRGLTQRGVAFYRPRYPMPPKIGGPVQGAAMAWAARRELARWNGWLPDVIDGHFAYPAGYAAVRLARRVGGKAIVTCHGSDLALYPSAAVAGRLLRWALREADCVAAVAPHLAEQAIRLGARRTIIMPNAVDTARFHPMDQAQCRRALDLPPGPLALCVGSLDDNKNQALAIEALAELARRGGPAISLALVGEGPARAKLARRAAELGVQSRVAFYGVRSAREMPTWMSAADWLVLASKREGWPTVYFEAMACGRPVITSNVAAARYAVCDEAYGIVVAENTPAAMAAALAAAYARTFDERKIRHYAQQHSWAHWAQEMMELMAEMVRPRESEEVCP